MAMYGNYLHPNKAYLLPFISDTHPNTFMNILKLVQLATTPYPYPLPCLFPLALSLKKIDTNISKILRKSNLLNRNPPTYSPQWPSLPMFQRAVCTHGTPRVIQYKMGRKPHTHPLSSSMSLGSGSSQGKIWRILCEGASGPYSPPETSPYSPPSTLSYSNSLTRNFM